MKLSSAEELSFAVRRSEKAELNELMRQVRYPVKLRVQEPHHKAYVLLLAAIEFAVVHDFALKIEQSNIVESAVRIIKMIIEYSAERKQGFLLENAIRLRRSLEMRSWCDRHNVLCECPGIDDVLRSNIRESGSRSLSDLQSIDVHQVQSLYKCANYEAQQLVRFARSICGKSVRAKIYKDSTSLTICFQRAFDLKGIDMDIAVVYKLLVIDSNTGVLIHTLEFKYEGNDRAEKIEVSGCNEVRAVVLGPYSALDVVILDSHDKHDSDQNSTAISQPIKVVAATIKNKVKKTSKRDNTSKTLSSRVDDESKHAESFESTQRYIASRSGNSSTVKSFPTSVDEVGEMNGTSKLSPMREIVLSRQKSNNELELNRIRKMAQNLGGNISVKRLRTTFPMQYSSGSVTSQSHDCDFSGFSFNTKDILPSAAMNSSVKTPEKIQVEADSLCSKVSETDNSMNAGIRPKKSFLEKSSTPSFFKSLVPFDEKKQDFMSESRQTANFRHGSTQPTPCVFSKEFTDAFF